MTYLEKYMREHPADDVSFTVNNACPGYGYWATSPKCLRHRTVGPTEFACMTCWNQEIPGTEKTEEPIAEVTDVKEENSGVTVTVEPIIKDSGDRTEFATGAVRDMHAGKGRMDLLPWGAIMEVSKHCEEGALKYGEHNVDKGIPTHSLCDSAARHLAKYLDGWTDEPHLRAAVWNLLWALQMELKHPELVDTPWKK